MLKRVEACLTWLLPDWTHARLGRGESAHGTKSGIRIESGRHTRFGMWEGGRNEYEKAGRASPQMPGTGGVVTDDVQ